MNIVLQRTIFKGSETALEYIFVQPPKTIIPLKNISAPLDKSQHPTPPPPPPQRKCRSYSLK